MFIIKNGAQSKTTSEPWYDLFEGGYFPPQDFLEKEEDIKKVMDAMNTVERYRNTLEREELMELI